MGLKFNYFAPKGRITFAHWRSKIMKKCKLCKHCVYKNPMKIDCKLAYQCDDGEVFGDRFELKEQKITIEEWESKYKPIVNPNAEDECSADRFETYGKDLDYVLNIVNTTPKKVWTLEDIDGRLIICAGYHIVNRMNYFITEVEWEDENIEVQYCDEDKLCFSTVEEGFEAIKEAYRKGDVVEGECADYLVDNYNECFDASVDPLIAIQAIQKFRQWDYETEGEDAIECFGGTEALSENGYYGFIFMKNCQSMQLPDGVRVGIQTEDGGIALDEGIVACFKETKCFNANDYATRQLIEMEFENLPDSEHKDNMIDEALQLVEECGYTVGEATNTILSEKRGV